MYLAIPIAKNPNLKRPFHQQSTFYASWATEVFGLFAPKTRRLFKVKMVLISAIWSWFINARKPWSVVTREAFGPAIKT